MELCPRRFELLFQLGDPRNVLGRRRAAPTALRLRLFSEANEEKFLALALNRLGGDAERDDVAVAMRPTSGDDNSRVVLKGSLNR